MKTKNYSYEQFEKDCQKIVKWIKVSEIDIKNIYGIPRGGLIIATRLSYLLDIPLTTNRIGINNETLVVDDISDTGNTIKKTLEGLRVEPKVVTLFIKNNTKFIPDFYVYNHKENNWIQFWWENGNKKDTVSKVSKQVDGKSKMEK